MDNSKIIEQQIKTLPEEIRKFVAEEKWIIDIESIVKKDNLTEDQKTALENEVLFVLIGLDLLGNLENNIKESLGVEAVLAEAIADELKEKVFKEIEEFLPTEAEVNQKESEQSLETPDLESLPPTKSTELEIPPEMELVPEGEVIDHTPRATPVQPKPPVEIPAPIVIETPKIQSSPVVQEPIQNPTPAPKPSTPISPTPTSYADGKDPYREPLE